MKPVIRSFFSSDVSDLVSWEPNTLASVYFPLELVIGIPDKDGGDIFEVLVATPEALRVHPELGRCFSGQHILIVMEYDWSMIYSKLEELVSACEGVSWYDIALSLAKTFHWEFEDYQELDA